jgi:hypothetical protein
MKSKFTHVYIRPKQMPDPDDGVTHALTSAVYNRNRFHGKTELPSKFSADCDYLPNSLSEVGEIQHKQNKGKPLSHLIIDDDDPWVYRPRYIQWQRYTSNNREIEVRVFPYPPHERPINENLVIISNERKFQTKNGIYCLASGGFTVVSYGNMLIQFKCRPTSNNVRQTIKLLKKTEYGEIRHSNSIERPLNMTEVSNKFKELLDDPDGELDMILEEGIHHKDFLKEQKRFGPIEETTPTLPETSSWTPKNKSKATAPLNSALPIYLANPKLTDSKETDEGPKLRAVYQPNKAQRELEESKTYIPSVKEQGETYHKKMLKTLELSKFETVTLDTISSEFQVGAAYGMKNLITRCHYKKSKNGKVMYFTKYTTRLETMLPSGCPRTQEYNEDYIRNILEPLIGKEDGNYVIWADCLLIKKALYWKIHKQIHKKLKLECFNNENEIEFNGTKLHTCDGKIIQIIYMRNERFASRSCIKAAMILSKAQVTLEEVFNFYDSIRQTLDGKKSVSYKDHRQVIDELQRIKGLWKHLKIFPNLDENPQETMEEVLSLENRLTRYF